jgi:hypothetical protein
MWKKDFINQLENTEKKINKNQEINLNHIQTFPILFTATLYKNSYFCNLNFALCQRINTK